MNLRQFSRRLFDFDAQYPRTIIAGVVFISVMLGWKVFDLEMDPSIQSMLPRDHSIVQSMEKVDELFTGSSIIIIAVESDSLFSYSTLKKLSMFQDSLESIDLIGNVTSLFTQKHILSKENGIEIEPLIVDYPRDPESYAAFMDVFTVKGGALNIIGYIVGVGLTLCFFQHMASGIRHLVLDTGAGYELKTNKMFATLTMVFSVLATLAFWAYQIWGK